MTTESNERIVGLPEPGKRRSRAAEKYGLEKHALAAKAKPGEAILALTNVTSALINSVRGYTGEPFSDEDGKISVHMRNSRKDESGVRRGDMYLVWHNN